MNMKALLLLPMLAAAPYALIETRDPDKTDPNNFQVLIRAVESKAYWDAPDEMKLEPGPHFIQMTAARSGKRITKANHDKSLYINLKPCFRYFVTGQVKSELDTDWVIRVLGNERILACKTKEDIQQEKADKKAKRQAKAAEKNTH